MMGLSEANEVVRLGSATENTDHERETASKIRIKNQEHKTVLVHLGCYNKNMDWVDL